MLSTLLVAGLALVGYVQAIAFTGNVTGTTLTKGSVYEVTWSSVDTDPSTLSIYLWNFVQWPPLTYQLALDVPTVNGKAYVNIPCDVPSGAGYQFSAINGTNTYVIYAQTGVFSLTGNCTQPSYPGKTFMGKYLGQTVEVFVAIKVVIIDVTVDKFWFIKEEVNVVETCNAVTATVTATNVEPIYKTVIATSQQVETVYETATVTVIEAGTTVITCPVPTTTITAIEEIYTSAGKVYTTIVIEEECEEEEETTYVVPVSAKQTAAAVVHAATTTTIPPYPVSTGKAVNTTVPIKFSSSANAQQGSSLSVMILAGVAALIAVFVM